MPGKRYDAVVVGSGQGGVPLASALAQAGHHVAMVEAAHVGGTCVNYGCTPTKTMIASARAADVTRRAGSYGLRCDGLRARMAEIVARKQSIVERFREGVTESLDASGVELIRGRASFAGPRRLRVELAAGGAVDLEAERVFLNTGARPSTPPIEGLHDVPHLDSTSIMDLDDVPDHLIAIGGGYVALEFAQLFRRLGSRVTVLARGEQLLSREDEDIARAVCEVLREDGIDVRLLAAVDRVRRGEGGEIEIDLTRREGGPAPAPIRGSHLLVATGRTPNTDALDLDRAGVQVDERGYVVVDEGLETTAPGVYALGDIRPGPAFTHASYDDSRVLLANLQGDGRASVRDRIVPYTVFLDPQLGRVGLSEREAKARGIPYRLARLPAGHVARAIEMDEPRGVWKALVAPDSEKILGAAIFGFDGGEVLAMVQIAMMGDLPYHALRDGIFAHPTLAEGLNSLFSGT